MRRPYQPLLALVPEGWGVVVLLGGLGLLLFAGGAGPLSLAVGGLLAAAVLFCTDAEPLLACRPRGVVSPVDGIVTHRRECHDPLVGREAIRIVVRTRLWGAYCLRAPIAGEIAMTSLPHASRIRADDGQDVVMRMTRGHLLGAPPVMVPVGERVGQGRRCGVRRLAREFELLVPADSRVEVRLGQRVRSGETVLATLLRKS